MCPFGECVMTDREFETAETARVLEAYPAILELGKYIRKRYGEDSAKGSLRFSHIVESPLSILTRAETTFCIFSIEPTGIPDHVSVHVIIMRNGIDHLAYAVEDYGPEELAALDKACAKQLEELKKIKES